MPAAGEGEGRGCVHPRGSGLRRPRTSSSAARRWRGRGSHEDESVPRDYAWGKSALIEYRTPKGERCRGRSSTRRATRPAPVPDIVYVYERLSQGCTLHCASERTPYNASVFTADGYFVLQPDIVFVRAIGRLRDRVRRAAVKKVLESGMVDPSASGSSDTRGRLRDDVIPTQTKIFSRRWRGRRSRISQLLRAIHWNRECPRRSTSRPGRRA